MATRRRTQRKVADGPEGVIPRFPRVTKLQRDEYYTSRAVRGMVIFVTDVDDPHWEIYNGDAWERWEPIGSTPSTP